MIQPWLYVRPQRREAKVSIVSMTFLTWNLRIASLDKFCFQFLLARIHLFYSSHKFKCMYISQSFPNQTSVKLTTMKNNPKNRIKQRCLDTSHGTYYTIFVQRMMIYLCEQLLPFVLEIVKWCFSEHAYTLFRARWMYNILNLICASLKVYIIYNTASTIQSGILLNVTQWTEFFSVHTSAYEPS